MKLSRRITLFSTGMLMLILVVVNVSIYFVFQQSMLSGELNRTLSQARSVVEAVRPSSPDFDAAGYLRAYVAGEGMVRVVNQEGEVLVSVASENQELQAIQTTPVGGEQTTTASVDDREYAVARVPVVWTNGTVASLEMIEPMTLYEETLGTLRLILIVASIVILIPSFLAAQSLGKFLLRPIDALVATMNQIREEQKFKRIEVDEKAKDELSDMGRTFNHMIRLLEENYEKQQQFVSDASHELKTPLTVINSYAQLLERWGKEKPEVLEEAVTAISSEAARMKEMTNQMLALASGDETVTMSMERVDVGRVFAETASQLRTAYSREIDVQVPHQPTWILGNDLQLRQLAFILIENALKYSEDGLRVLVRSENDRATVYVEDFGIGIAEEDIPFVFDRFYRVDKARARKTGGSGLGLSIAKKIVEAHHGEVAVKSEVGRGTTFSVAFTRIESEG
ncbi:HAMP domain-containing protein [Paenalkalicoccus suaedae]|uniref:Signal transduction histidine-protein kinase ArlS n=1 Tax=Paenalkalicoccus suaedae TaxID=2592382 RepID=A0A859FA83_9BACI|nr:HAMP domain-containing histidine kinase [Paenalkalicoccus suaedae]QKS70119.1 HAMP domain-containing protein [Paenalkalicoccus suaedae]